MKNITFSQKGYHHLLKSFSTSRRLAARYNISKPSQWWIVTAARVSQ